VLLNPHVLRRSAAVTPFAEAHQSALNESVALMPPSTPLRRDSMKLPLPLSKLSPPTLQPSGDLASKSWSPGAWTSQLP
jgi:hypothetical protein